jgi:hypothetical protein
MFKHNNKTERDSSSGASAPPPSQTAEPQNGESSVKKPSIIKRLWTKLDLDLGTVMMMFKGSLPPIIAIAAFQAPAFSSHFGTLGYLVVSLPCSYFGAMEMIWCLRDDRLSRRS